MAIFLISLMANDNFYYKKDRLNQLKGFCAFVENGSINKAAEKLNIEPATINKRIKSLERDLKVPLFSKEKNGRLALNDTAKNFYEKALKVIQLSDNLYENFLCTEKEKDNKVIRIASNGHLFEKFLPEYIFKYRQINKDVKFELFNIKRDEAIKKLENEELDVCFYLKKDDKEKNFLKKIVLKSHVIFIMPKGYYLENVKDSEIGLDDFFRDFISMGKDVTYKCIESNINDYAFDEKIKIKENASWDITIELARAGNGTTGVWDYFIKHLNTDGLVLKNVKHLFPNMEVEYTANNKLKLKKSLREFLELF